LQQENDKLKHLLEDAPYHIQHRLHPHPHPQPHAPVSPREHGGRTTPQANASTASSGPTPSPSAPTSPAVRLFEHRSASVPSSPKDGLPTPGGIIAPLSLPPASAFQQFLPSPHHAHPTHRHPASAAVTTPPAASQQQSTYKSLRPIMPAPQQQPQQPSPPQTQPSTHHFPHPPPHHPYHPTTATTTPPLHHPHPHAHPSPSLLPSPASPSASPNHPASHSRWLPPQRMTKYEKVYGNTCRY
jgi:hypothetical protein